MEKSIAVLISHNELANDNSSISYQIEISDIQMANWIAHLSLLANGHIDSILLNSKTCPAKIALSDKRSDKRKMIYPHVVKEDGIPKLIFPAKLLNSLLDIFIHLSRWENGI